MLWRYTAIFIFNFKPYKCELSFLGKCLENVNVIAGDSRDTSEPRRGRFFPFVPEHHLIPGHTNKDFWYWQYIYYKTDEVNTIKKRS